jgi:tRNA pseudouridine55 synthase
LNGFYFINKPKGPTSFDIIRRVRRIQGKKKIGHSGTLDPEATGLLILAVGTATRLIPFLPSEPKRYSFSIQFGKTTDTLDSEGTIIDRNKPIPTEQQLTAVVPSFIGTILQKPPDYSAIKINGKRAYTLARKKQKVTIPPREITIHSLTLYRCDAEKGEAFFTAECSNGTYIRSLARDIAEKAGTIGYASSIHRTAISSYTIDDAVPVEKIQQNPDGTLHSITDIFSHYPSYTASRAEIQEIAHGNTVTIADIITEKWLFIYNAENELIAVTEKISEQHYHPIKVFIHL